MKEQLKAYLILQAYFLKEIIRLLKYKKYPIFNLYNCIYKIHKQGKLTSYQERFLRNELKTYLKTHYWNQYETVGPNRWLNNRVKHYKRKEKLSY